MTSPDLKLRVLAAARTQPAPARTDRLPSVVACAALAAGAMAAVVRWAPPVLFGEAGGAAHAVGRPAEIGAWIVGGTALLAIAATALALPARRSMLSPPRRLLVAVAVAVPVLVAAWLSFWHVSYADPMTRTGWRCLTLSFLTAPWPFAALAFASRRVDPRHPGVTGAALGAAAGAWAAAMVEVWCPLAAGAHVLFGHALPVVVLALAGAAFGARVFRLRGVTPARPRA